MIDPITVAIGRTIYEGWTEARVTRGLDRCAGDFDLSVSERWQGQDEPWQIAPFSPCTIAIGGDLVLTGYVDSYQPGFDKGGHTVRIAGRSKTEDLIDCMPEIQGGQYNGYALDQIARAICAPFGIGVVVAAKIGEAFADATIDKTETGFAFLERLCRLRSVLALDDEAGRFVLGTAGSTTSAGALVQGENILDARGRLTAHQRFSKYIVRAQVGLDFDDTNTTPDVIATAVDPTVPRYRPHAEMAESQLDVSLATSRAQWRASYNAGRSIQADVTVQGFRQPDGTLWRLNQLVPVTSAFLKLKRTLLVACVEYRRDAQGSRTRLTVAPQEAYTPDPGEVRLPKNLATAGIWSGAQKIAPGN